MVRLTGAALASTLLLCSALCAVTQQPATQNSGNEAARTGAGADRVAPRPPATAAYLQTLLNADNFIEFAQRLPQAEGLTAEQEQYFRGTLAYREGRFQAVVEPLVAVVRAHDGDLTASQRESAFEILAQTEAKTFQYSSSAEMYGDIEELYGPRMGEGLGEIREKRHIEALLSQVPAETVRMFGGFTLQRGSGPTAGEYPIRIAGKEFSAQLDTGASVSLVSETTAKQWGVRMLEGTATLHGYGGGGFAARPGIVEELQIGTAELHHVVVFVTADANLYIPEVKRQTHALLGYPVASVLGRLTFGRDGTLRVSADAAEESGKGESNQGGNNQGVSNQTGINRGAPMWVGDGSLLVALGTEPVIQGNKLLGGTRDRLFELDTGAGNTYLTDHYLAENRVLFKGEPPVVARLAGAGGTHEIPAYQARKLPLFFGATPVLCSGQHVLTQPQGGEAESYYGVVGQDVLRLFSSYTLDFRTMRMSVAP